MTATQWSEPGFEAIAHLLGARAGLTFRPSQRSSIEQGISRAMIDEGVSDFVAYLSRLKTDTQALDNLLAKTTVGETYFFRDPGQFRIVSERILPDICQRSDQGHTIHLWSAACASGEEPYSLAMLLHRKGLLSRSSILGTDISRDSLNVAQGATYRDWSLRGQGKALAAPYMTQIGDRFAVKPEIRESVRFEYLNLAMDNYPSTATGTRGVDLILCRNVMIYFDRETIESVAKRFYRCLVPGGWLVTASSDPPIHQTGLFDVISTDYGMVFRKGESVSEKTFVMPPMETFDSREFASLESSLPADSTNSTPVSVHTEAGSIVRLAEAKAAMDAGEYEQSAAIAAELTLLDEAAVIHVKALANLDVRRAERACAAVTQKQPLSKELHYLHAVLLMDLNRHSDAAAALNRVLYLDRTLALAHFSLATALRATGHLADARRELLIAQASCTSVRPTELVPLGEDQRVGDLLAIINLQLDSVDKAMGARA